jgi:uncharacterized protein YcfL
MKKLLIATLLGSTLILGACSSQPQLINYRGGELKGVIKVERSALELTEGGLPQAKAILKNNTRSERKFEYKFMWLDANDMPVDEDSRPWKAAFLKGKDSLSVNGTGPTDKARKFQIQVREPQGVTR